MTQLLLPAPERAHGRAAARCARCDGLAWLPDYSSIKCGACGYRPTDALLNRDGRKRRALPDQPWPLHFRSVMLAKEKRDDSGVKRALRITAAEEKHILKMRELSEAIHA